MTPGEKLINGLVVVGFVSMFALLVAETLYRALGAAGDVLTLLGWLSGAFIAIVGVSVVAWFVGDILAYMERNAH